MRGENRGVRLRSHAHTRHPSEMDWGHVKHRADRTSGEPVFLLVTNYASIALPQATFVLRLNYTARALPVVCYSRINPSSLVPAIFDVDKLAASSR